MHFSTFLIAATALCATSASACFNTGEHWGSHPDAKAKLAVACNKLTGPYNSGKVKHVCSNAPSSNLSYNFQITNKSGRDVTISQADCVNNIGGIIDNCGHGGEATINGVVYRYI